MMIYTYKSYPLRRESRKGEGGFQQTHWIVLEDKFQACRFISSLPRGLIAEQLAGPPKPLPSQHSGSSAGTAPVSPGAAKRGQSNE